MADRPMRLGRLIAGALADAGVEWAFTVPGESFLGVLDALPEVGIRVVATRHEGGAGFMAEAAAQLTGRPAACLATRAVGAANLAIGLHTARQNSTPVVALIGQVATSLRGREAFQEVDQVASFGRLCKWAAELDQPARAGELLAAGLRQMVEGRPGPVLMSLPEDLLDEWLPAVAPEVLPTAPPTTQKSDALAVVDLLDSARRPLIIAGGGVRWAGATARLVELAERLAVPVVAAWRRPDVFPNDHPMYLGMTGFGSPPTVLQRVQEADAVLVLGCRLSEVATFGYRVPAPATRWAHVDMAPLPGRQGLHPPEVSIAGDAADFLDACLALAERSAPPEREAANAGDRAAWEEASRVQRDPNWSGPGVHPAHVIETLQRLAPADSILATDAGNFGLWLARGFRFGARQRFLGPTSGAMGYGLPAAIASSLCRPEQTSIALCGDGGFAMTMPELETAVRAGASPIAIVFDNRSYGTIAMHQQREGRELLATELGPIDFAAVARACGAQGGRVTRDAEFEPALRDALTAGRPAVVHLEIDPRWISPDLFAAAD